MMYMEENKNVIISIDGASGDNMTVKVTKKNPRIEDHQNVLEAINLDGVFSKQEDQSQKRPAVMVVLIGVPCVASGGKGKVIIQLGIALTKRQMCWCQRRIRLSCIMIFIEKQFGFGRYECHFRAGYRRAGQLLNFMVA